MPTSPQGVLAPLPGVEAVVALYVVHVDSWTYVVCPSILYLVMALQTKAYLAFKAESERLTNVVVLVSHAVPVLRRVLALPAQATPVPVKPADTFINDQADGTLLQTWAIDYDKELARLVVLSVFSYFE